MSPTEASFLKHLVTAGLPVLWFPPQLDGAGNWLPEIQDGDDLVQTGTWNGYNFPRWKDPEVRTLHEVRNADHVDELLAREPRPAFMLMTGHGVDIVDLDFHGARHSDTDYHAKIRAAIPRPVAVVTTPTGGTHVYVASSGKHNESNSHSQVDYRGERGLAALPGTRRMVGGEILSYTVVSDWDADNLSAIPDTALALYDEFRAEVRRCNVCAAVATKVGLSHGGVPLGDGTGWDALEETPTVYDPDDPFGLPPTRELADGLLTWEELLSPWFNVVGRRETDLYLIRAGKAMEGRGGKSAVIHCADNRIVVYSSDLPVTTGTQLSKLDVFCAIKEQANPGTAPDDFADRMKWMRDRWAGLLYSERGLDVPRHLRLKCADDTVARAPAYPVLPEEFWEAHPVLKRIRAEAEPRRASPEAVLMCVMLRVLLHIGHQVVLPPLGGNDPEEGATLNAGAILVAGYGEGKGRAEKVADRYVPSKHMIVAAASGQAFAHMYGKMEKTPKEQQDPHDPLAAEPKFVRTHWSRYLQYDEMDEFEAQMNMQNSTLSPVLRKVLTEDHLSERVAIGRDSKLPGVEGFRTVFVAHGQPTRLDWLLSGESSGGFPQRLWYVYAAAERPAEEYLDPDFVAPPIEPLDLAIPQGWQMPDDIRQDRPKVCVPIPRDARYESGVWEYECPEDDRRGMLNVRLKAYAALLVLLPGMEQDDVWKLATDFHSLCYRTRHYALELIKRDKRRKTKVLIEAKVHEQRTLGKARSEDELADTKAHVRSRILAILSRNDKATRRQFHQALSSNRRMYLDEVLEQMETDNEIGLSQSGTYALK